MAEWIQSVATVIRNRFSYITGNAVISKEFSAAVTPNFEKPVALAWNDSDSHRYRLREGQAATSEKPWEFEEKSTSNNLQPSIRLA